MDDMSICDCCNKLTEVDSLVEPWVCTVYTQGGVDFRKRQNYCPFNPPKVEKKKKRVRVGQQKQRRFR